MKKTLCMLFATGLLGGCTPTNMLQPTFQAVAPEKEAKSELDVPRRETRSDNRKPVSAKDVTERTAQQTLRDLDAELENDSSDKPAKN